MLRISRYAKALCLQDKVPFSVSWEFTRGRKIFQFSFFGMYDKIKT